MPQQLPHIGAEVPPEFGQEVPSAPAGKTTDDPVTLGELMADPKAAMYRMGAILKKDVSDPKLWLTVAAGYFAPKLFNAAAPTIAKAAAMTRTAGQVGMDLAPDAVGVISPRLGNALAVAQRARAAMKGAAAAPEPVQAPQPAPAPHMDLSTPVRPSQLTPEQLNQRMTQGTGTPLAPAGPKPPISTPVPTATAEAPPSQAAEGTPKAASIEVGKGPRPKPKVMSWEMQEYTDLTTKQGKSPVEAARILEGKRGNPQPMAGPTSVGPAAATPPEMTPAPTAPVVPPSPETPLPRVGDPVAVFVKRLMDLGYSSSEATQAWRWVQDKIPIEDAMQRLQAMRQLQSGSGAFSQLPSNMEVGRAVTERNQSGRWRP